MHLRDGIQTHYTVAQRYQHLADTGEITEDARQRPVVAALDRVLDDVRARRAARKSSPLGWLFAGRRKPDKVKGLYVHGGVGRGKTMLMDLFFAAVPARRKRRVHFNDFMADVHDRIQRHRQARKDGATKEDDPIPPVARALAEEAWVLCFDEFSVTDIADAMVLSRLFSALFENGVVLVATSNVAPDDLYRDGLNRQLFVPFIALLKANAAVLNLDSDTDYRMEKLGRQPVYLSPLTHATARLFDEAWAVAAAGRPAQSEALSVKGRMVPVPLAAGDAARFAFADLCEKPLGARDYLAIAARYRTLFLDAVPVLAEGQRNEAKRFILLVDTLYDKRMRLVVRAAARAEDLYPVRRAGSAEAFEFDRTVSRLTEMQGRDWLQAWASARHQEDKEPVAE